MDDAKLKAKYAVVLLDHYTGDLSGRKASEKDVRLYATRIARCLDIPVTFDEYSNPTFVTEQPPRELTHWEKKNGY